MISLLVTNLDDLKNSAIREDVLQNICYEQTSIYRNN